MMRRVATKVLPSFFYLCYMALVIKGEEAIVEASNTVNINNTTGNYNADSNPEGYGGSNQARSERYEFIQKYTVNSSEEQVVEVIIGEEATSTMLHQFSYTKDEVSAVVLISLPIYGSDPNTSTLETGFTYYNSTTETIREFNGGEFADVTEVNYEFIGKVDATIPSEASQKVDLKVLVLEEVNTWLRTYFIDNIDSKSIKVTSEDVLYLKALRNSAKDDFANNNYLSVQESIDEMQRILTKQQNNV